MFISDPDMDLGPLPHEVARAHANAVAELKESSDDILMEMWQRPYCVACDYGGACRCDLAGRVLAGRGHALTYKNGNAVEPL